jgi:hypothetical protein
MCAFILGKDDKPKRKTISTTAWAIKKKRGCIICGKTSPLEKAHIRAHSKGGSDIEAMCRNHHKDYDAGKLNDAQLRKLGISRRQYEGSLPKKGRKQKKQEIGIKLGNVKNIGIHL